jgi:hypothetical protein
LVRRLREERNYIRPWIHSWNRIYPVYQLSLGWTALTDPDSFYEALKAQVPAVLLNDGVISKLKKDAAATKMFLPPGWDRAGRALQVPPTLKEGSADTGTEANLDGVGQSWTSTKASKVLGMSKTVETPAPEE